MWEDMLERCSVGRCAREMLVWEDMLERCSVGRCAREMSEDVLERCGKTC